ncbi:MAG: hypothetical protein JO001_14875 [Alphaproteobacteria bacterium]|nr:hypothetical protein [Alphaproteobacteria bacterium]
MPDDGRKPEVIETTVDKLAEAGAELARRGLAPHERIAVLLADEYARLKRRDRRVGLTEDLPEEWIEAVRKAKVPDEFAALDAELQ